MEQKAQRSGVPLPPFDQQRVADVMITSVQVGQRRTKGDALALMMIEGAFGGVPIVDDDQSLIGLVTEFDLFVALDGGRKLSRPHSGKELSELSAEDIMTPEPIHVTPQTDILTALYVLQSNHLIRVPVVDQRGKLVGIVARRDVLRGYLHSSPQSPAS